MAIPLLMTASDVAAPVAAIDLGAPAKLNLYLEIIGVREDGYHLIDSLVAFADFGDQLHVERAEKTSLSVSGPFAGQTPADVGNLVLRALQLLERAAGRPLPVAIYLEKRLPAGAGLGGGSADAAATLRGVRSLYDLPINDVALAELGLELGADLPVCLAGRPAHVSGIGERLTAVQGLQAFPTLLVYPGVGLSTPSVYQEYDKRHLESHSADLKEHSALSLAELAERRNDLQSAAETLEPGVTHVLDALSHQEGCTLARMSGSGSACFGLFETMQQVEAAASRMKALSDSWWIQPCRV